MEVWEEATTYFVGTDLPVYENGNTVDDNDKSSTLFGCDEVTTEFDGSAEDSEEVFDGDHTEDHSGGSLLPPPIDAATEAHQKIKMILFPPRSTGPGYKDPGLDKVSLRRLREMRQFLWAYTSPDSASYGKWIPSSLAIANTLERGPWFSRKLRQWCSTFIKDGNLPWSIYGTWSKSILDDENLQQELFDHLLSVGKFISATDVQEYMSRQEVQTRYGCKKGISLRTAQYWLHKLGYRWRKEPSGQYVDGHEREDVVDYRQHVFLPAWKSIAPYLRTWSTDGMVEEESMEPHPREQRVTVWYHDESTYYQNDRRKLRWVRDDETPVPQPKGEGVSLMISDFISADYGWLQSPDGSETARIIFKAGKNRDGYFTNESILKQVGKAMDILEKYYPQDKHVFIFDNATTHTKRVATAPSARNMPKGPSTKFGALITVIEDGKIKYSSQGKPLKKTIQMGPGVLPDGTPQPFYNDAGVFKGTTQILLERGLIAESRLKLMCKNFDCASTDCCQRRVLYNQPDFSDPTSALETFCHKRGFRVIFIPKFHCELNPIEQCWGASKRVYREYPLAPADMLEKNVLSSLATVHVDAIRRYVVYFTISHIY